MKLYSLHGETKRRDAAALNNLRHDLAKQAEFLSDKTGRGNGRFMYF